MELLTKRQAAQRGMSKFFTGKPCIRNHLTFRYTASGACITCIAEYAKKNKKELNDAIQARRGGQRMVTYTLHVDDVAMVDDFVNALIAARNLTTR